MTDALYDLLHIIDILVSVIFQIGILILAYRYIELRKIKQ